MTCPSKHSWLTPSIALGLTLVIGCDQPGGPAPNRPQTRAPGLVGVDLDTSAESAPPVTPPAETKPVPILGAKTQDIRETDKEKQAGAVVASPKIVARDPIRITGNAYVSIIGQAATLNIKKAVDFYQAETGEYPKTTEEFMEKIIKANNIALPKLPFYQEYTYDVPTHSLVVMEYPARKEEANYPK